MSNLPVPASSALVTTTCPGCHEPVDGPLHACAHCRTPYHKRCWDQMMACAVRGCVPSAVTVPTPVAATLPDQLFFGSLVLLVFAIASNQPVVIGAAAGGFFLCWWRTWGWVDYRLRRSELQAAAPAGTEALCALATGLFVGTPMLIAFGLGVLIWAVAVFIAIVKSVQGLAADRDKSRALLSTGIMAALALVIRLLAPS